VPNVKPTLGVVSVVRVVDVKIVVYSGGVDRVDISNRKLRIQEREADACL
jgi:hypothetical protein